MAFRTHPVLVEDPVVGVLTAMQDNALSVMLVSRAIDLLPIPAALVVLGPDGVRVEASNTAFDIAGLGAGDRRMSLIAQIESPELEQQVRQAEARLVQARASLTQAQATRQQLFEIAVFERGQTFEHVLKRGPEIVPIEFD